MPQPLCDQLGALPIVASFQDAHILWIGAQVDTGRPRVDWAFCDALSFNLFDRSPHAWTKVTEWSNRSSGFEKRTAFALLWSLTVHDVPTTKRLFKASPSSNRQERHACP